MTTSKDESVASFPRRHAGSFNNVRALHYLNQIVDAFQNGVLVPADDLSPAQQQEVRREIGLMALELPEFYRTAGETPLAGSIHLQRHP